MCFLVEREWALVGGQLREGVRNGSNRSHPLHWGRFVRLCLSLGGCVFAERTLREIGWMVIHTYFSVAWIVKYDDPYRDPYIWIQGSLGWMMNLGVSGLKILVGWRFCEVVGWRRRKRDYVWGRVIGSGRRRLPVMKYKQWRFIAPISLYRPQPGSSSVRTYSIRIEYKNKHWCKQITITTNIVQ